VLTIAYNILAGGDDLELLRQDEGFLDALGAQRLFDPTTAGDFCRRFAEADDPERTNLSNHDTSARRSTAHPGRPLCHVQTTTGSTRET
jgi:hypothetical protein